MTNSNDKIQTSNQIQNSKFKTFDLEERTALYGEKTIKFCRSVHLDEIIRPLVNQVIRSGTSIGANYMEANGADSKKDFNCKIGICKKEAKETMHWMRMLAVALPERVEEIRTLWKEAHELSLIFGSIIIKNK